MTPALLVRDRLRGSRAPRALAALRPASAAPDDLRRSADLVVGLAAIVGLRFVAIQDGVGDPILAGAVFGAALLALAALDGIRNDRPAGWLTARGLPRATAIGLAGGGALVALAFLGRALAGVPDLPPVFRSDLFPAWAGATVVVAAGEEAVLRGALLTRLTRAIGPTAAVLLTSLAFAVMHVPFYGWRVVPLDFGVGLWFAGLRLASRGLVAPAIAHTLADLATWWL